jgi:hypothetical protein
MGSRCPMLFNLEIFHNSNSDREFAAFDQIRK